MEIRPITFRQASAFINEHHRHHGAPQASNFAYDGIAGGKHWTGVRDKGQNTPSEMKKRFVKDL